MPPARRPAAAVERREPPRLLDQGEEGWHFEDGGREEPAREEREGRSEAGKRFEEGTLVPCHRVPLEVLRRRLPIEASGVYWGQTGGISGLIQGVHVRGRDDLEVEVRPQNTNLESILKWATGSEDKLTRVHFCGARCPSPLDAENLLHGDF